MHVATMMLLVLQECFHEQNSCKIVVHSIMIMYNLYSCVQSTSSALTGIMRATGCSVTYIESYTVLRCSFMPGLKILHGESSWGQWWWRYMWHNLHHHRVVVDVVCLVLGALLGILLGCLLHKAISRRDRKTNNSTEISEKTEELFQSWTEQGTHVEHFEV